MKSLSLAIPVLIFTAALHAGNLRILVQPFENLVSTNYSWLSSGIADTLSASLSGIPDIEIIQEKDRRTALQEIRFQLSGMSSDATMVKLGELSGANAIISGSYTILQGRMRITARIISVSDGKTVRTVQETGALDDLFALQDDLTVTLLLNLTNIRLGSESFSFPAGILSNRGGAVTRGAAAFENYSRGLSLEDIDPDKAYLLYESAIRSDPAFYRAYLRAAVVLGLQKNRHEEAFRLLAKAGSILSNKSDAGMTDWGELYLEKGIIYRSKGALNESRLWLSRSRELLEKGGRQNQNLLIKLRHQLALLESSDKNYDKALALLEENEKLMRILRMDNTLPYLDTLNDMGLIFMDKGNSAKAMELFSLVRITREVKGLTNTHDYAGLFINIANAYDRQQENFQSLDNLKLAAGHFERMGLQKHYGYGHALYSLAVVSEKLNGREEALQYYKKAYQAYTDSGYEGWEKESARKNIEILERKLKRQ